MIASRLNSPSFVKDAKWFGVSFAIHLSLFVFLMVISGTLTKNGGFFSNANSKKVDQKKLEGGEVMDFSPYLEEVHLFDGLSYTDYRNNKLRKAQAQSQANSVLNKLRGLKIPSGTSGGAVGGLAAGKAQVGGGSLLGTGEQAGSDSALLDNLRKQPFTFKASLPGATSAGAGRSISDKERAEIRKKFNELQQSFRKVYAKGLMIDPHLEATVGFEAQVKNDGFLQVIRFRTRGKFKEDSIELMKREMEKLIAQLSISPDLAGTVIRGESVFAR